MEADLEVREQGELGASLGIAFEPDALVTGECLAQQALAIRRVAGSQARRAVVEIAGELEPDLLEDLEVAARNSVAGELERVERCVELMREAADPRLALEEAAAQQPAPERRDRVQQPAAFPEPAPKVLEQVLAADCPTRLFRGPRRVGAPVRALAGPRRAGCGELRVAVGNLEVPDDRALDRGDPPNVVDARRRRRSARV